MREQNPLSVQRPGFWPEIPYVPLLFWVSLYLFTAYLIQFHIVSAPIETDTAYHAVVGRLIKEHGILQSFPWTPFSWLSDHYADKELLFHLLFVPFIDLGWITASKVVGMLLGAVLLTVTYFILRSEGVRWAGLWALLPLITSAVFFYRFAIVRPHLLSLTLALILLWATVRGRLIPLAAVSLIYPWSYVAFWQIPAILLTSVETTRLFSGERIRWKLSAAVLAGIIFGLLLHPNTKNLLQFNWIVMTEVLFKNAWHSSAGIELGSELLPFTAQQWLRHLLAGVAMTAVGLVIGWRERRRDCALLAFAIAALAFGLLSIRTARFAEYFLLFAAVSLALTARHFSRRWAVAVPLVATLLYTAQPMVETVRGLGNVAEMISPRLAASLQQRIPAGAQVFTTDWGHTGTLMLALPDRKFIVALDPTLFQIKDPELYRLWYDLPRHPQPGMAETIRNRFGAHFVVSLAEERFTPFYFQLSKEPGVETFLMSDDFWIAFDLTKP